MPALPVPRHGAYQQGHVVDLAGNRLRLPQSFMRLRVGVVAGGGAHPVTIGGAG